MDLEKALKNKINQKIIKFFHENPASIDTPRGVSTWTNQDIKKVRIALKELADLRLLTAHKASSITGYCYTRNKKLTSKIDRMLKK